MHHRKCSCDIHHNILTGPDGEELPPVEPCEIAKLDILKKCQDLCDKDTGCKGYVIHYWPADRWCKCELATESPCTEPDTEFKHVDDTDPTNIITHYICNGPYHENTTALSPYAECGSGDTTEWGDGCRIKGFGA